MESVAAALQGAAAPLAAFYRDRCYWSNPEIQLLYVPVVAYWLLAGFYDFVGYLRFPWVEACRLHSREEANRRNRMSKVHVISRVLFSHFLQSLLGLAMLLIDPPATQPSGGALQTAGGLLLAMLVMDAWQYAIHRYMHENKFLYKHIHSQHHRLVIPYAYGALYNQPLESFFLDALGAAVALYASGMSSQVAVFFFTFATCKTVFDHCNYSFPVNPVHNLFPNNARYHDVHHDPRGIKKNFSQPFFTIWDHLMGTYLDPKEMQKMKPL